MFKKLLELADDKVTILNCIKYTENQAAKSIYETTLQYIERKSKKLTEDFYSLEDVIGEKYAK